MIKEKKNHTAVFGIFENRRSLEVAIDNLKDSGFRISDISALLPNRKPAIDFAHEKATKAPEGTATGGVSGVLLGGGLGWLVGIGALAIPGLGPFVAGGPILTALAGAGIGGAVGGVTGALIGMGIPEYEAKRYESHVQKGGLLLSVHVDNKDWAKKAKEILKFCGAKDIDVEREKHSSESNTERRSYNQM